MDYMEKLQALEQERHFVLSIRTNDELLEYSLIISKWFMDCCDKNRVYSPKFNDLKKSVRNANNLLNTISENSPFERKIADKIVDVNYELLNNITINFNWFLKYCNQNNFYPPVFYKILHSIEKIMEFSTRLFPNYDPKATDNNSDENNRFGNRTVKQHSYKVLVPYHTVW